MKVLAVVEFYLEGGATQLTVVGHRVTSPEATARAMHQPLGMIRLVIIRSRPPHLLPSPPLRLRDRRLLSPQYGTTSQGVSYRAPVSSPYRTVSSINGCSLRSAGCRHGGRQSLESLGTTSGICLFSAGLCRAEKGRMKCQRVLTLTTLSRGVCASSKPLRYGQEGGKQSVMEYSAPGRSHARALDARRRRSRRALYRRRSVDRQSACLWAAPRQ
jgi:hypothetical protein